MLKWMVEWRSSLVLLALVVVLGSGWAWREQTFAADKVKLLESKTVVQSELKFMEHAYEGRPRGQVGIYFDGQTQGTRNFVVGQYRLNANDEPHPIHNHAEEEVLIVTQGEGEIACAGKTTKVGPGSVMFTGPDVPHGIKNTSKEPLTFYFIKYIGVSR
jgi:mannose-6-phosphate isomerase-like protein (cupin superfamily)